MVIVQILDMLLKVFSKRAKTNWSKCIVVVSILNLLNARILLLSFLNINIYPR